MSSDAISDPEVLAFIERTEQLYPDDTIDLAIAGQREIYDGMSAAFRQRRPSDVQPVDTVIDGPGGPLALRGYHVEDAVETRLLYLHGGGFVVGGLDSHDDVCAEIAHRCRIEVQALDYRLCPEHPHPAAYEDTLAAVDSLAGRPLIIAGDSAGGNLAAAATLARRTAIVGQILIYPGLGGEQLGLSSYADHAHAPMLTTTDVRAYGRMRLGADRPSQVGSIQGAATPDETLSPLLAKDLSTVPPCFVSVAEVDPLRDDGIEYVDRLRRAGSTASLSIEHQLPHGYLRGRSMSRRIAAAFDRIIEAISAMTVR